MWPWRGLRLPRKNPPQSPRSEVRRMTVPLNLKALQAKMAPAARGRAEAKAGAMLRSMSLDELREALGLTQEELAKRLQVKQPAVAKLERRVDVRLGTLRALDRALRFPLDRLGRLALGGDAMAEAQRLLARFLGFHVGVELQSRRVLDELPFPADGASSRN